MNIHLLNNDHLSKDIDKEVASKNTDVYELYKSLTEDVDTMKLENIVLYDNHEYKQELELGKKVYEIINNRKVDEDKLGLSWAKLSTA